MEAMINTLLVVAMLATGIWQDDDTPKPGFSSEVTMHPSADYVADHLGLDSVLLSHVQTNYYAAGHLMYLNDSIWIELASDVRHWQRSAVER